MGRSKPFSLILKGSVLVASLLIIPLTGHAVTVSIGGTNYDIVTLVGTYGTFQGKFNNTDMPWFGSQVLAESFAVAVGPSLDQPNINWFSDSPLFAFDDTYIDSPGTSFETRWIFSMQYTGDSSFPARFNENTQTDTMSYAVVAPEPSSGALLLLGSGLLLWFRKRAAN